MECSKHEFPSLLLLLPPATCLKHVEYMLFCFNVIFCDHVRSDKQQCVAGERVQNCTGCLQWSDMLMSCFQPGKLSHEYIFQLNVSFWWRNTVNISWAPENRMWQTTSHMWPPSLCKNRQRSSVLYLYCAVYLKAHGCIHRVLLRYLWGSFWKPLTGDSLSICVASVGASSSPTKGGRTGLTIPFLQTKHSQSSF